MTAAAGTATATNIATSAFSLILGCFCSERVHIVRKRHNTGSSATGATPARPEAGNATTQNRPIFLRSEAFRTC